MQSEHRVAKNGSWEKWVIKGSRKVRLHREDGPAFIGYKNGEIVKKEWWINGKLSRKDGPAHIEYENGRVIKEVWRVEGQLHREGGPAWIAYKDGEIIEEQWWLRSDNNRYYRHRENGPAWVTYEDGEIVAGEWWVNGKRLCKEDFKQAEMVDQLKAYLLFTPIEIARLKKNAA